MKLKNNQLIIYLALFLLLITSFSSMLNIYEKREAFFKKISSNFKEKDKFKIEVYQSELANKILNGGYLLVFRHAERERWKDVQMYDSVEATYKLNGEDTYFKNAVCLSKKGMKQAKMIGEILTDIKLPIFSVASSPSCRARQTAEVAFGGYDEIKNIFLYRGPFNESREEFSSKLKEQLLEYNIPDNSNLVISAHNALIHRELFDKIIKEIEFDLGQGGFYVIEIKDKKLILLGKFYSFHKFNQIFKFRPND